MERKIWSLIASAGAIILGFYLSANTNRVFYGLIVAGILYGIYDIYLIATHKQETEKQQERQRKLAEQKTFDDTPASEITAETPAAAMDVNPAGFATIIAGWYKEKMGYGGLPVTVNGVSAGVIQKNNVKVIYHTNVSFNVITIGIYKTEIELSPGDTVEYFAAGNGIHHSRTIITRKAN
jgi:Na+/glutamate symporter